MAQQKTAKKPGRSVLEKRRAKQEKRAERQRAERVRERMQSPA